MGRPHSPAETQENPEDLSQHDAELEEEVARLKAKVQELEKQLTEDRIIRWHPEDLEDVGEALKPGHEDTAGTAPDASNPAFWGLRVREIIAFWESIKVDLEEYCSTHEATREDVVEFSHLCSQEPCPADHAGISIKPRTSVVKSKRTKIQVDTHFVVSRYIKRMTKESGKSYALMVSTGQAPYLPLKVSTFVSHTWGETFESFVDTLDLALHPEEVVFVSSFSLNLNAPLDGAAQVGEVADQPPFKALAASRRLLVVMDTGCNLPNRLWCLFEVAMARSEKVPVLLWPHRSVELKQAHGALEAARFEKARASDSTEEARLRAHVEAFLGFQWANPFVRELLLERLWAFNNAFQTMTAERSSQERLWKTDILRLRALLQEETTQLERRRPRGTFGDEELLMADCEFAAVDGPMCRIDSYVPEVWDSRLRRKVLHVNGLCLLSCGARLTPAEGLWRLVFCVKRSLEFQFDTEVVLKLDGIEQARVNLKDKLDMPNIWTSLLVCEFKQEKDTYREVEVTMESLPTPTPVPKHGLFIDRVRAERISESMAAEN